MTQSSVPSERLPTFIIGGARKAGTTSLWAHLGTHPDIVMGDVKEPQFFSRQPGRVDTGDDYGPPRSGTFDRGWEQYADLFRGAETARERGEASTMYLDAPDSPALIAGSLPDTKLIFCLRNPVDRVYSHYWFEKQSEDLPDFADLAARRPRRLEWYLHQSRYSRHLSRFLDHFDRAQVHLVVAEEMFAETRRVVGDVCSFLGVDPGRLPDEARWSPENERSESRWVGLQRVLTQHRGEWTRFLPRSTRPLARSALRWVVARNRRPFAAPAMDPTVRAGLLAEFEEEVDAMESLLGRELALWRV